MTTGPSGPMIASQDNAPCHSSACGRDRQAALAAGELDALLDRGAATMTGPDPQVRVKTDEIAAGEDRLHHRQRTLDRLLHDDPKAELSAVLELIGERFELAMGSDEADAVARGTDRGLHPDREYVHRPQLR